MEKFNTTPTPEYMEAVGRAMNKYGPQEALAAARDELKEMIQNGDSICNGLVGVKEKHQRVAEHYPALYRRVKHRGALRRAVRAGLRSPKLCPNLDAMADNHPISTSRE
jgi:hypothetical protein